MNASWYVKFLDLAHHVASWSKDPSTQVGAVIANDRKLVVGIGFNGFPRGVVDLPERYNNRDEKYPRVVHAEVNAILNATSSVRDCSLFCTSICCAECAKIIVQSGIIRVVTPEVDPDIVTRPWMASYEIVLSMFKEAGVELILSKGYQEPKFDFRNEHPYDIFPLSQKTKIAGQI